MTAIVARQKFYPKFDHDHPSEIAKSRHCATILQQSGHFNFVKTEKNRTFLKSNYNSPPGPKVQVKPADKGLVSHKNVSRRQFK